MSAPLRTALGSVGRSSSKAVSLGPLTCRRLRSQEAEVRRPNDYDHAPLVHSSKHDSSKNPDRLWKDAGSKPESYRSKTGGDQDPDPNKVKMGNTLRILRERMPTLLQYPLPQQILSPDISLHLFPSTHPHLPTVSGRVPYTAALWSSPIAWNRVPIIGNVQLEILAERVTSEPLTFSPRRLGAQSEQLIVRWTEKTKSSGEEKGLGVIAKSLRFGRDGVDKSKAFTGLFIFDFDHQGRILSHTIERTQAGGDWEQGVGAKVVGLTDRLLGGIKDPGDTIPTFQKLEARHRHGN